VNADWTITTPNRDLSGPADAGARGLNEFRTLLGRVWGECQQRLAKLVVGLGVAGGEAGDVLQDVYLSTLENPPGIATEIELTKWLYRVTINRARLMQRRRKTFQNWWTSAVGAWRGDAQISPAPFQVELNSRINAALTKLAADDRTLIVLRYFLELNSREIGELLEQPESTVRSRLRAARRQLADDLADWNDHE
jgi:RNA polymerase sigma-70 factor (ECF subfamily)